MCIILSICLFISIIFNILLTLENSKLVKDYNLLLKDAEFWEGKVNYYEDQFDLKKNKK